MKNSVISFSEHCNEPPAPQKLWDILTSSATIGSQKGIFSVEFVLFC